MYELNLSVKHVINSTILKSDTNKLMICLFFLKLFVLSRFSFGPSTPVNVLLINCKNNKREKKSKQKLYSR